MNQDQFMSLIRTGLGVAAGFAIAHGVSDQTWQLIAGIITAVAPLLWGYFAHTDSAKLAAVEALPDVKNIVVKSTATDGVAEAARDADRPKVIKQV